MTFDGTHQRSLRIPRRRRVLVVPPIGPVGVLYVVAGIGVAFYNSPYEAALISTHQHLVREAASMCLLFLCGLHDVVGRDDDLAPRTVRERRPDRRRRDARPSFLFEVALAIKREEAVMTAVRTAWLFLDSSSGVTHRCGLPRGPVAGRLSLVQLHGQGGPGANSVVRRRFPWYRRFNCCCVSTMRAFAGKRV